MHNGWPKFFCFDDVKFNVEANRFGCLFKMAAAILLKSPTRNLPRQKIVSNRSPKLSTPFPFPTF